MMKILYVTELKKLKYLSLYSEINYIQDVPWDLRDEFEIV